MISTVDLQNVHVMVYLLPKLLVKLLVYLLNWMTKQMSSSHATVKYVWRLKCWTQAYVTFDVKLRLYCRSRCSLNSWMCVYIYIMLSLHYLFSLGCILILTRHLVFDLTDDMWIKKATCLVISYDGMLMLYGLYAIIILLHALQNGPKVCTAWAK